MYGLTFGAAPAVGGGTGRLAVAAPWALLSAVLLVAASHRDARAGDERTEDDPLPAVAAQVLRDAVRGFPNGTVVFENVIEECPGPEGLRESIRVHFLACARRSWDGVIERPPSEEEQADIRAMVEQQLERPETRALAKSSTADGFELTAGLGWVEFARDMTLRPKPGWSDPSSKLRALYTDEEMVYVLNSGWTEQGQRKTLLDVKRHPRNPTDFLMTAPSPYWHVARTVPTALAEALESQPELWTCTRDGTRVEAVWHALTPDGPWPKVPMYQAAPSGGRIRVVVDERNGFLALFEFLDASGAPVERIEYADVIRDERGSLPLQVDRTTWYPSGDGAIRGRERFRGRSTRPKGRPSLAIMIPPGATVTDFRVTPPVIYKASATPLSDDRIVEISAEGTRRAETAQERTDPGHVRLVPEEVSAPPRDEPAELAVERWVWPVAAMLLAGALILAAIQIRRSLKSRSG